MDGKELSVTDAELVGAPNSMLKITEETPEQILEKARHAAVLLQDIVKKKKDPVTMGGEIYFEIEDWETLGNFFGLAPKVISSNFIQFGNVVGFEARAGAFNKKTGAEITTADAMCLNDEEEWSARTKYEYHYVKKSGGTSQEDPGSNEIVWEDNPEKPGRKRPKKVKVKNGTVAVPMFQLRSMAQTRAVAKALRFALGWVVVLAGYKATPAEELDGMTDRDTGKGNVSEDPTAKKAPPAGPTPAKPANPPAAANPGPANGPKIATGFVIDITEPNKGGYVNISLEGYVRPDGKLRKFATKDEALIDAILDRRAAGEKVSVEYVENANPSFADNIVKVMQGTAVGDAQE